MGQQPAYIKEPYTMSHVVEISDAAYQVIADAAAQHGQSPGAYIEAWAAQTQQGAQEAMGADQAWFWTLEWQAGERRADADLASGRFTRFDSDEAFLEALDEWDADADS